MDDHNSVSLALCVRAEKGSHAGSLPCFCADSVIALIQTLCAEWWKSSANSGKDFCGVFSIVCTWLKDTADLTEKYCDHPRSPYSRLGVAHQAEDNRSYGGYIQIATCDDIGCKYGLGDSGRRQISAGRPCRIHDQIEVFARQP